MNYSDVRDRVQEDDRTKWDELLEPEEMRFQQGRLTLPRLFRADDPEGLRLTPWATHQLCQRLGIPVAYFRRCPPALQDANANHWLEEAGARDVRWNGRGCRAAERWLLRGRDDTLRGVLTERYARLDNADLLAALLPLWESRVEVGWFVLNDETLHLRLLDPQLTREALPGDRLVAGLHIANSEVGKRSVTVDALVFRLVCQNGLVKLVKGRSLLHQRHVALSQREFALALREAVREALTSGTGFMERLVRATQQPVRDLDRTLATLVERWRLSQSTERLVRQALLCERNDQQETLYGLVNGLTRAAQRLDPDERYTLETLAGQLLDEGLPRAERPALPVVSEERWEPRSLFAEEEFLLASAGGTEVRDGFPEATGPEGAPTPARPVNG
jgi:hypothetical protein